MLFDMIRAMFYGKTKLDNSDGCLRLVRGKITHSFDYDTFIEFPKITNFGIAKRVKLTTQEHCLFIWFFPWQAGFSSIDAINSELNQLVARELYSKVDKAIKEFDTFFKQSFPRDSSIERMSKQIDSIYKLLNSAEEDYIREMRPSARAFIRQIPKLMPLTNSVSQLRRDFEAEQQTKREAFFTSVESNPLTEEQRLGVIRNNDFNLVLAAAGTGKTSVIVAKCLDIIDQKFSSPEDILVLAYNKAAAEEVKERVKTRAKAAKVNGSERLTISTFHALGRNILKQSGVSTRLTRFAEDQVALDSWLNQWLARFLTTGPEAVTNFLKTQYRPVDPMEFENKEEYEHYLIDNPYRTLTGVEVKGYQELLIANWLYLNGIAFEYESNFVKKRRIETGFDYKPDFYIRGTDIYLEHFGIDRNGNTRADIDTLKYNEGIKQKRKLHEECGTILIETYHYDWVEGKLEERLQAKLKTLGIKPKPIPHEQVLEALNDSGIVRDAQRKLKKALSAIRVEHLSMQDIKNRLEKAEIPNSDAHEQILKELLQDYKNELHRQDAIDFDDMISLATECVKQGRYTPPFRFILVDEFQDISGSRMKLLQSLREFGSNPVLTFVGDDWQAIYRFAGGKLELTTRFEQVIGSHSLTKLQKTFRYNESIAHTAGTFVMQNPEQYKKQIETHHKVGRSTIHLVDSGEVDRLVENAAGERAASIVKQLQKKRPGESIAVLARYHFVLNQCKTAFNRHGITGIKLWTFHASKGLETDNCILVGFAMGKIGFPNQNKEDEVVEALLPSIDAFPHSEERRLMYVALTRAKNSVTIVANPMAPSTFINELLTPEYDINVHSDSFKNKIREIYKCPACAKGYLQKKKGQYGEFYSCTSGVVCNVNTRVCTSCGGPTVDLQRESRCKNPDCGTKIKICPKCGRPMRLRTGKFGQFYGCSGYGIKEDQCTYTERVSH